MPLKIDVQCRVISYWSKLIYPTTSNLSSQLYAIVLSHFQHSINTQFTWSENVKNILIPCDFSGFWDMHTFPNRKWLIKATKQKLVDLFLNDRQSEIENNTSCYNYRLFKTNFVSKNIL